MTERIIYVTTRIVYTYDECRKYDEQDPNYTAICLTINPNKHTIENGVQVNDVDICFIEETE